MASSAYDVFQLATGEKEFSARELGTSVLLSLLPGGAATKLLRKACKKNSFVTGTLVQLEDEVRPIEEIEIGDLVLSYNELTGEQEYKEVTHLIEGYQEYAIVKLVLENGEPIESTGEHPFYINQQWINAEDIVAGDQLFTENKELISVVGVEINISVERVYNITVEGNHNYYVGEYPVLVHNAFPWCKVLDAGGKLNRKVSIDPKKLQKKFNSHGADFGLFGNWNKGMGESFKKAIESHVKRKDVIPIPGEYKRGNIQVLHYLDPKSGLNVMVDTSGNFVSGWKLSAQQLKHVTTTGILGGGK